MHLNKILLLQKRAVRIVNGSDFYAHCDPIFYSLSFLKIFEIYKYYCCLHVFKNEGNYRINNSVFNTRQSGNLYIPFYRLYITNRSLYHNAPMFYNELPDNLRSINRIGLFKRELKNLFLSIYNSAWILLCRFCLFYLVVILDHSHIVLFSSAA